MLDDKFSLYSGTHMKLAAVEYVGYAGHKNKSQKALTTFVLFCSTVSICRTNILFMMQYEIMVLLNKNKLLFTSKI